jgi:hypothetical protein
VKIEDILLLARVPMLGMIGGQFHRYETDEDKFFSHHAAHFFAEWGHIDSWHRGAFAVSAGANESE